MKKKDGIVNCPTWKEPNAPPKAVVEQVAGQGGGAVDIDALLKAAAMLDDGDESAGRPRSSAASPHPPEAGGRWALDPPLGTGRRAGRRPRRRPRQVRVASRVYEGPAATTRR